MWRHFSHPKEIIARIRGALMIPLLAFPSGTKSELKNELKSELIFELFLWPITSDFRPNLEILAKKSELKSELILQLKSELICPTWHCQHR